MLEQACAHRGKLCTHEHVEVVMGSLGVVLGRNSAGPLFSRDRSTLQEIRRRLQAKSVEGSIDGNLLEPCNSPLKHVVSRVLLAL